MIDVQLFTVMVLMALVTTFTTSPVVAFLYPPHRRHKFGSRPMAAAAGPEAMTEGEENEQESKVPAACLPVPVGLELPAMGPAQAAAAGAPCAKPLRLMLVAQRMTDVPGLALLMGLIGPERVSAVRFVESEEIPLSIIMSQGTLTTGTTRLFLMSKPF